MADDVKIIVDTREVDRLYELSRAGLVKSLRRIGERGEQLLRDNVPRETNNLAQGVSSDVHENQLSVDLIVSARAGRRGARSATVHYPSGETKQVKLRAQKPFDYAEAVARGRKAIRPRQAKVLLIPVSSPPQGESYLTAGGETFVLRRSARATKPNEYDKRALAQLQKDAPLIVERQLEKTLNENDRTQTL